MIKVILVILSGLFCVNTSSFAKTITKTSMKKLILTLDSLSERVAASTSPSNFNCMDKTVDDGDAIPASEYFKQGNLSLFNFIKALVANRTDHGDNKLTQEELNKIMAKYQQLNLRSQDIAGLILMIGSAESISMKTRASIIGGLGDIQSVKKTMEGYVDLGSVACTFLFDNNMKNNLGSDSIFYNHNNLPTDEQKTFELSPDVLTVVGRCKGYGLYILPEYHM